MDDLTASYSSEYERLCREGGFAVARVDLRGTGRPTGSPSTNTPGRSRPTSARLERYERLG